MADWGTISPSGPAIGGGRFGAADTGAQPDQQGDDGGPEGCEEQQAWQGRGGKLNRSKTSTTEKGSRCTGESEEGSEQVLATEPLQAIPQGACELHPEDGHPAGGKSRQEPGAGKPKDLEVDQETVDAESTEGGDEEEFEFRETGDCQQEMQAEQSGSDAGAEDFATGGRTEHAGEPAGLVKQEIEPFYGHGKVPVGAVTDRGPGFTLFSERIVVDLAGKFVF
ncbi:MAG: hypothetical protein RL215_2864 [Planctomycetota bacterium]